MCPNIDLLVVLHYYGRIYIVCVEIKNMKMKYQDKKNMKYKYLIRYFFEG
jgi:hypothetical protein